MPEEPEGEKTEEPTPHKLREARKKGQIFKSREPAIALVTLLAFMLLRYLGPFMWTHMASMARDIFYYIPYKGDFTFDLLATLFFRVLLALIFITGPIAGIILLLSLTIDLIQTGFNVSWEPLLPRPERINPLEGFKRMFSIMGLVELVKSIVKIIIVFWISWAVIKKNLPLIVGTPDLFPWDIIVYGSSIIFQIAIRIGIFYLFVALLDWLFQRWDYMRKMRMTRQEVKEEYKRLEGDPLIKQRIRQMQMQIAQQRMMAAVPGADVVVTNPVEIAVALKYDAKEMKAPKVIAKGLRLLAEEIKKIAEEVNIPIIENVTLARSLYKTTKLNEEIPSELFRAVAEVLAFIFRLKKEREKRVARVSA